MAPDEEKQQLKTINKVGRNSLCPCGSGLKFKYCHGNEKFRAMCQQEANRVANRMLTALIQQMQAQKGICPRCRQRFTGKSCEKCGIDFLSKEEAQEYMKDGQNNDLVLPAEKKITLPNEVKGN